MMSFYLHGFWGTGKEKISTQVESIDYTQIPEINPENYILNWGAAFAAWFEKKYGDKKFNFIGYSQGGRLLMGLLSVRPDLINKLILISSHPGLTSIQERELRLQNDRTWAKKFRSLDWKKLEEEWGSQSVFQGGKVQTKNPADFDRETLALCLENWSLAHQPNYRNLLAEHKDKVHVILGEKDQKYLDLYSETSLQIIKAKGAAHRVPSDQPELLAEILKSILK